MTVSSLREARQQKSVQRIPLSPFLFLLWHRATGWVISCRFLTLSRTAFVILKSTRIAVGIVEVDLVRAIRSINNILGMLPGNCAMWEGFPSPAGGVEDSQHWWFIRSWFCPVRISLSTRLDLLARTANRHHLVTAIAYSLKFYNFKTTKIQQFNKLDLGILFAMGHWLRVWRCTW